jgi:hypothetical protein
MRADLSVSCDSDTYRFGVIIGIFMTLVYPIGLPLFYYFILEKYKKNTLDGDACDSERKALLSSERVSSVELVDARANGGVKTDDEPQAERSDGSHEEDDHDCEKDDSTSSGTTAFLTEAYKDEFWYWEIVETYRRLFLTAVVAIVGPGTNAQAVFAILLSVFFTKLYNVYDPYCESNSALLADVGQYQVFFTFFGGLIIQGELLGSNHNTAVSAILIIINMGVLVLGPYLEFDESLEKLNAARALAVSTWGWCRIKMKGVYALLSCAPLENDESNMNSSDEKKSHVTKSLSSVVPSKDLKSSENLLNMPKNRQSTIAKRNVVHPIVLDAKHHARAQTSTSQKEDHHKAQIIVAQATLDGAKKELSFVRRKDKAHDQLVKRLQEKHASETTESFQ